MAPPLLNQLHGVRIFVRSEIVHDHDVAGTQAWKQEGAHIGLKHGGIGRPFDGHAGGAAVQPHGTEHGRGAPVALRRFGEEAAAPRRAPAQARQVGLRGRFVEEDEPGRLERALVTAPPPPGPNDVRPILFGCAERLFLKDRPISTKV